MSTENRASEKLTAGNVTESQLQVALLLAAPARLPSLRLFRRNVVAVRIEERTVRAGIKGQCDLYGYVRGGRIIEIELKSATRRSTPEQVVWAEWCKAWGVPHLLLRAAKDETVENTVNRWCFELERLITV